MRQLLPLLLFVFSSGCQVYCGRMEVTGLDVDYVNPDENERFAFDRTYGLQCFEGRGAIGTPLHTAHYIEDGIGGADVPLVALSFYDSLRNDDADWALTTAITSRIYLEADRIEEGAVLASGDGMPHAEVLFNKSTESPIHFEDGDGNRGDTLLTSVGGVDGEVEIRKIVQSGADCDDTEGSSTRRWTDVRWQVRYDLVVGEAPGPEVHFEGKSWVKLDDGPVGDPLYEDLVWWCSREE